jgi:hypothetical protein
LNDDSIRPLFLHFSKSRFELLGAANHFRIDRRPGGYAAKPDLFEKRLGERIGRIGQCHYAMRRRQHLSNQLYAFAGQFRGHAGHAGDVAARPVEALNKSGFDRISRKRHDDWNIVRRPLRSLCGRRELGHDQINMEPHQLRGQFR